MFDVGKRVACIAKGPWRRIFTLELTPAPLPVYQHTYVVEAIEATGFSAQRDGGARPLIALSLAGLPATWDSADFVPVRERETSVEVFKQIVAPAPKELVT